MKFNWPVAWRVLVWLMFNLGAQAPPIFFLWMRSDNPIMVWNYVNCTLATLIAIGMLAVAISDVVTERGHIEFGLMFATAVAVIMGIVYLQQVFVSEIVEHRQPDVGQFVGAIVSAFMLLVTGTCLKWRMWSDSVPG